jgi:hypothetical protein
MLGFTFQRLAQLLRFICRLVYYGAAIDDVNEAAGKPRAMRACDEPNRHDRGLAQAGRQIQS